GHEPVERVGGRDRRLRVQLEEDGRVARLRGGEELPDALGEPLLGLPRRRADQRRHAARDGDDTPGAELRAELQGLAVALDGVRPHLVDAAGQIEVEGGEVDGVDPDPLGGERRSEAGAARRRQLAGPAVPGSEDDVEAVEPQCVQAAQGVEHGLPPGECERARAELAPHAASVARATASASHAPSPSPRKAASAAICPSIMCTPGCVKQPRACASCKSFVIRGCTTTSATTAPGSMPSRPIATGSSGDMPSGLAFTTSSKPAASGAATYEVVPVAATRAATSS